MNIFKNKRIRANTTNDELAQKIAGNILVRQSRIAGYLNRKTRQLSGKTLLFALIAFCVLFGSYCVFLLISAIS